MKHALSFTAFMLYSMIGYASEEIKNLLIASRTDDRDDVTNIKSVNYDNKNIDDRTLHESLILASNLVALTAQHNNLNNPQTTSCALLTTLKLNNGTIQKFSIGDWLNAMPALRTLKLAHNKITTIASANDISTLTCGGTCCGGEASWCSKSLQELDISHNQLTEFNLNII